MLRPEEVDTIYYHSPCQDGLGAAWSAWDWSQKADHTYEFLGIQNGQSVSFEAQAGKKLLFLDYAPTDEQVIELKRLGCVFSVIDHHKTNEARFKDKPNAIFKMDRSGCGLAWEYFNYRSYASDSDLPRFLRYIQDRDLWTWKDPNSKAFCEGLWTLTNVTDSFEEKMDLFNQLRVNEDEYTDKCGKTILLGQMLLKVSMQKVTGIVEKAIAGSLPIGKYSYNNTMPICLINCDSEIRSDLGSAILTKEPAFFAAIMWHYDHKTEKYWLSMRANGKLDVSDICKKYDGGGHANAAGCSVDIHPSILFNGTTS